MGLLFIALRLCLSVVVLRREDRTRGGVRPLVKAPTDGAGLGQSEGGRAPPRRNRTEKEHPMTEREPHERHSDDARADAEAPTDAVTDEVRRDSVEETAPPVDRPAQTHP
jgi:hypothetical protein